jgi:Serine dehydratase alpha chain
MLFKRGSTISAAEGGCQAEVGVACSMAAGALAACLGAPPAVVLQSAEVRKYLTLIDNCCSYLNLSMLQIGMCSSAPTLQRGIS